MQIKDIKAIKVLNSRAQETIAVRVKTRRETAWGSAPSGASTGKFETPSYKKNLNYAIKFINSQAKKLKVSFNHFSDLGDIEKIIKPKSAGGNPLIALEFSILNLWAKENKTALWQLINDKAKGMPKPLANVIGGGAHAGPNAPDIQEILICPKRNKFKEAALINAEIHRKLKDILKEKDLEFKGGKTDEGAWITSLSCIEIFELMKDLAKKYKVDLGMDLAASQLFKSRYSWKNYSRYKQKMMIGRDKQIKIILDLIKQFKLFYVEDPLNEQDFVGFAELTRKAPNTLICADDLYVTNLKRTKIGQQIRAANAMIIKPNQIGSLLKTKEVFDFAKEHNIKPIISHRSGETLDTIISHLAKAWEAPYAKIGAAGGERIAKINELIKIEFSD